jgi:DNA-directed RNA polymerase subunit RPC12/RpoP
MIVKIWKCSRCGAEIGRSDFPPDVCPSCGARIINGVPNPDNPRPPGGHVPPLNMQPPGTRPKGPPINQDPFNIPNAPQPVGSPGPFGSNSASAPDAGDNSSVLPWVMGGVAGGALLLALGVFVVIKVMEQSAGDPEDMRRRPRRRRLEY